MELLNSLSFGWQPVDVVSDELFQLAFALQAKVASNSRELVVTSFGHFQREGFHFGLIDQHLPPPLNVCI